MCKADAVRTRLSAALAAGLLLLTACSDDEPSGGDGGDPQAALDEAKQTLDETSGVHLVLSTDDLPEGVTGAVGADGVGTHAPAFEGTISVVLGGQEFEVPVVAVDDTVYAQIPLTVGWQDIDPAEYGAPDPAALMSPDTGFSNLLVETNDLEQGDSVRGGDDNSEVLTEYIGTVSGDVVSNIIPTASGDFDATYTITDDGELREATLTGVFYDDADSMTYTVTFDDYGTEQDITAP